jgi:hypothetical protein
MGRIKGIIALSIGIYILIMAIAIIGSIVGVRPDLAIALFINFLVFWILTFLIPGVLLIAKYKMSEKSKWWYMIAPLTTLCMLIYMILVIFLSGNNFWNYYTQYILIAIGISILLSLILICYAHEM